MLSKGGAKATDASTVEFTLEAPNGNFPYLLSSDNYNTIILPADYDGDYEKTMNGTGPLILEKYTQGQARRSGRTRVLGPGAPAELRQHEILFYGNEQAWSSACRAARSTS